MNLNVSRRVEPSKTIANVTALRLLSTYCLVIYHGRPALLSAGFSDQFVGILRAGTDLFLVCSAFLAIHTNSSKPTTGRRFFIKRAVRIVPLYWIITLLVFVLSAAVPTLFQATRPEISELLKSLFFIPYEKKNHAIQPMVFVAWTLNYIMLFAVIYAASIGMVGGPRAWIVAIILLCCLMVAGVAHNFEAAALRFYTSPILADFIFGIILSKFYNLSTWASRLHPRRNQEVIFLLLAALSAFAMICLQPYLWPHIHRSIGLGIPCLVLIGLAIRAEILGVKIKCWSIKELSKFTFSIYLSHFFCTGLLALFVKRNNPLSLSELAVGLSATILGSTILGCVLFYLVESPIARLFRSHSTEVTRAPRLIGDRMQ